MFKFKKDTLKYENAPAIWLEARGTPLDFGREEYPAYKMASDDINAFLNGLEANDLYNNPSRSVARTDYGTSAVNPDGWGALFAEAPSRSKLSMVHPQSRTDEQIAYADIPDEFKKLIPQAIYAHELYHSQDERLDKRYGTPYPYKNSSKYEERRKRLEESFLRRGHTKEMAEKLSRRENPAEIAEDKFWDGVLP